MYDSRTDHARNGVHWRRSHDVERMTIGYGDPSRGDMLYRMAHQAPAMTIEEGLREYQDDLEERNIANDGLVIAPTAKVEREPYRTESADYDVRTKGERIMARIEASDRAKRERSYASQQPSQYGSLIQASTRRRTRR